MMIALATAAASAHVGEARVARVRAQPLDLTRRRATWAERHGLIAMVDAALGQEG